jgi:hypothetical protein
MYMLRSVFIDCIYALALLGLGLGGFAHEVTRDDIVDMFGP